MLLLVIVEIDVVAGGDCIVEAAATVDGWFSFEMFKDTERSMLDDSAGADGDSNDLLPGNSVEYDGGGSISS